MLLTPVSSLHEEEISRNDFIVDISALEEGFNSLDDFIIKKTGGRIEYVISKVCDHNGGRLILKGDCAVCPMHNWTLNLHTLHYTESFIKKKTIDFTVEGDRLHIPHPVMALSFDIPLAKPRTEVEMIFISHACVMFRTPEFSIVTDPWLVGPAFMNGWWLSEAPKVGSVELLRSADMVYISHNHPDHLHPETLSMLDRDTLIVTGAFKSGSSEKMLRRVGFRNIVPLEFKELYRWKDKEIFLSVLKSGDFRDDSGIYLNINGFQALLTVDCNYLNSFILPRNIDLLMTSFASGASGYPVCFDILSEEEKERIVMRNRKAILTKVGDVMRKTEPSLYIPYAGYFYEAAPRDAYIKDINVKNSAADMQEYLSRLTDREIVNPYESDRILFKADGSYEKSRIGKEPLYKITPEYTAGYVRSYKNDYRLSDDLVFNYFRGVNYTDKLCIFLAPADDNFNPRDYGYLVDFSGNTVACTHQSYAELERMYEENNGLRKEFIRVREESLACVLENRLPWEDISIGFQCRIKRNPDVYNSEFWYHFTNVYIGQENFRYNSYCGACNILEQKTVLS